MSRLSRRAMVLRSAAVAALPAVAAGVVARRPNILVIMADDLGFSDIGPFGSEISTPNLDALAKEGRVMTAMYATPMPHASHAEFLFTVDHHLTVDRYAPVGSTPAAPPKPDARSEPGPLCIAKLIKGMGYHTYMIGTWDSGSEPGLDPKARGFERSHALTSMAGDYYYPSGANVPAVREHFQYIEDGVVLPPPSAYVTDLWTDRLIGWLEADKADGRPFFAYAAYTAPHFPLQAPDALIERQRGRYDGGYDAVRLARIARQKALGLIAPDFRPAEPTPLAGKRWDELTAAERAVEARRMEVYAAMVENLDANVGRLIKALKDQGRYENTLVVFTSTNGAAQSVATHRDPAGFDNSLANMGRKNSWIAYTERWAEVSNAPFARWKAKASEGGVTVPFIVRLPGPTRGGPPISAAATFRDLAVTLLGAAVGIVPALGPDPGLPPRVSLKALWQGGAAAAHPPDALMIEEYRDEAYVRRGRWKALLISDTSINAYDGADPANAELIAAIQANDFAKAYALRSRHPSVWKLYDIAADRGETTDLAQTRPDVLRALVAEYQRYRQSVGLGSR